MSPSMEFLQVGDALTAAVAYCGSGALLRNRHRIVLCRHQQCFSFAGGPCDRGKAYRYSARNCLRLQPLNGASAVARWRIAFAPSRKGPRPDVILSADRTLILAPYTSKSFFRARCPLQTHHLTRFWPFSFEISPSMPYILHVFGHFCVRCFLAVIESRPEIYFHSR